MKKTIYVSVDENGEPPENLLAWSSLEAADEGKVGIYRLVEEIDTRTIKEIKRKGSKKWFKP